MNVSRWLSLVGLGVALGGGLGLGAHVAWPESPYVRGLFVGERRLPRGVSPATWLDERRPWLTDRTVILRWSDGQQELSMQELGVDVDVETTLARVAEVGHRGSTLERLRETHEARMGRVDVPIVWRLREPTVATVLEGLATRIRREPVDARIDIANKARIPDVPGRELDLEGALAAIAELDFGAPGFLVVDLPTRPLRPLVTLDSLANVDVTRVVSTYETRFSPYVVGRAANVRHAASFLDGAVIPSGAVFSFNEAVGPRSLERGFHLAPEIQGDELTTGVGGGTCQVSSTLFAASVFGALEIVERKSHSQVSSYAKMGLDATVSYPTVDLKIRNPLPFPVMIHTSFPDQRTIRVELLGGDPPADVTYAYGVGGVEDFVRRITVKPNLKPGTRIRRQKGARGYDVTSVVTIRWRDGRVEERSFYSGYRPAPEVYWVAPGYDETELPPLPTHAKGVEGRLADGSRHDDGVYDPMSL